MRRVGWGSRRKNIWEDLRQEGIGRFKVTGQRRQEDWHEQCQGPELEETSLPVNPRGIHQIYAPRAQNPHCLELCSVFLCLT